MRSKEEQYIQELKRNCFRLAQEAEFWKREAIKNEAKLGEIRIKMMEDLENEQPA